MSLLDSEQATRPDPGGPGELSLRYPLHNMDRHLSIMIGEFCTLSLRQVLRNPGPTIALLTYALCIGCSLGQLTLAYLVCIILTTVSFFL